MAPAAGDICCSIQTWTFHELDATLNPDMIKLTDYCKTWCLQPSIIKTVSSLFHLHHASTIHELNVYLNGQKVKHEVEPVYLGVTLDRTLSYHAHLKKTAAKVKTRNDLLSKLAGSSWGARAPTLRMSALATSYSVAEYYTRVWSQSSHTKLVDMQLHAAMHIISGTLCPTPLPWLPVLSNIAPSHIRQEVATGKLLEKVHANSSLPLHNDLFKPPAARLPSRRPLWSHPPRQDARVETLWREEWISVIIPNQSLITDSTICPLGFDLPHCQWSLLNRFWTGKGLCAANQYRWGLCDSPLCSCGATQTMTHIVDECPLTTFSRGLEELHHAIENAITWLDNYAHAK
ncbi:uncharacterized protein LOC117874878 [Trachemys scripta elegans]|uniref:uncharacterized protein LOC117874878 n=1 Tax=Trachemys scripta elegans TaxID=31138 RepID=UPI001554691A|nr:uncharacterized protein LOC117874878 [Trachemys scripta elegans]XP_034621413.1 uncharacterized protein LOC117874878 [Trachemys scripta elegans]